MFRNLVSQITQASPPRFYLETRFLTSRDRPIAHQERSPFLVSDERDPNNHRPVSGISPPTTTNSTPQRVAAWAKRLSSVAIGNSNLSANSK